MWHSVPTAAAGLNTPARQAEDLHIKTKLSFVCRYPDFPQWVSLPFQSWPLWRGTDQSRQYKLLCCKTNQNLVQLFCFVFFIILYLLRKSRNQPSSAENHTGLGHIINQSGHILGHIINPSTGVGCQWRKPVKPYNSPIKAKGLQLSSPSPPPKFFSWRSLASKGWKQQEPAERSRNQGHWTAGTLGKGSDSSGHHSLW